MIQSSLVLKVYKMKLTDSWNTPLQSIDSKGEFNL